MAGLYLARQVTETAPRVVTVREGPCSNGGNTAPQWSKGAPAVLSADASVLTQREAAHLARVSVSYLRASRCPKILLPGRGRRPMVRYRRADVLAWLDAHRSST